MRRSCAPSMKIGVNIPKSIAPVSQTNYLSRNKESRRSSSPLKENSQNITASERCIYSVVWSKRTTKKHKTWEGDGTLEIKNKTGILKDMCGNTLGTLNSIKVEDIFDGNQLVIGSKEIEIQEKILDPSKVVYTKNPEDLFLQENAPYKEKKRKLSNIFVPNLHLSEPEKIRKLAVSNNEHIEPLLLPPPSYLHQWKFNEEKRPLTDVKVAKSIVKSLRPHQREGVIFLYECVLGLKNLDYFGAILADDMGLGKTLQCLALCHTLLKHGPYGGERVLQKVLIATPSSLTETWNKEICKWLGSERMFAYVVDAKNKIKQYSGQNHIPFIIVSYETLINNISDFEEMLFDLLICDEGHRLKNQSTKVSLCLKQLKIQKRIILSGTPIQNDLQEFYSLIDFVNPGILGEYKEYKQKYENPIVFSRAQDASVEAKELGIERTEELNRITSKFVLRRTQSINNEYLPTKKEFIVFVRSSELQQLMMKKALEWYEARQDSVVKESISLQVISVLKKICNHPSLIRTSKKDSPLISFLEKMLPRWDEMGPFDSGKLELVEKYLQNVIPRKEKVVLVSNHTKTLDMLMGLCDHSQYKYLRIDGTTPASERNSIVEKFNKANTEYKIFLLSSKAGGVGLNLCGASKLILFDIDWNPATDLQAMSRIWRDGQKKDVEIYRLITAGTIEEKIFQRQIMKTSLSGCVINHKNSKHSLKFSDEDLKDLFTVQEEFDLCATHDILNCDCLGNGEVPAQVEQRNDAEEDDPFRVNLADTERQQKCSEVQLDELKKWQHFKPPISQEILKSISMLNAEENIVFIFSTNQTNIKNCQNQDLLQK